MTLMTKTFPEAQRTQGIESHMHWFQIWPQCISSKFDHQVTPLALVPNLANMQCHLYWLQFWPQGGATCISYKFGHQVAPLALIWIALLSVSIALLSSSARVTSVKSAKGQFVRETRTHRSDPRYTRVR